MVLGWMLLGSFVYDWAVREVIPWWKLLAGVPMVVAGWLVVIYDH
jgi:hypothetical protein